MSVAGAAAPLGVKGRSIWAGMGAFLKQRTGRLWDSFYYSQSSTKYVMCFLFPAGIFYTRFRADTKLGYHVFINEESIYPDYSHKYFDTKWTNGRKLYLSDETTVAQLKAQIYGPNEVPADVKVACRGRVFEDTDNVAMAVRAFCKRDPRLLLFKDEL
ncbi:hypothetical protein BESB_003360 [Besnoitia besnoiti]|uniref:Uncharacterized protein n=1 Tax=Besnoitia besnoiti TaxID=94643 RepID=A0A2A9MJ47_BESBE|nr:hypothetical protein BESB_003360 [Besnoitia besnoiti]PFH37995.1 hypothetical protein BESB_003360 [Besnoitia besnoiti]